MKTCISGKKWCGALLLAVTVLLSNTLFAFPAGKSGTLKGLTGEQKILHVLNRLGFGPRPGDVQRVRSIGLKRYIEQQLDRGTAPGKALVAKLGRYEVLKMSTEDVFAKYPNPGALLRQLEGNRRDAARNRTTAPDDRKQAEQQQAERRERRRKLAEIYRKYNLRPPNQIMLQMQASRILRAVYSEHQLEEVMVDFWANHFNVYSGKAATRWYIPSYERDVIRKHALGNFRDLVVGTAKHPAMLFYLDNFQSVAPESATGGNRNQQRLRRAIRNGTLDRRIRERLRRRGLSDEQIDRRIEQIKQGANRRNRRGINENYARELMELHTLGVDGGYTQKDITEVARAFTGWTIFDPRGARRAAADMISQRENRRLMRTARQFGISPDTRSGSFVFVNRLHDKKVKTVLGRKIDKGGIGDGLQVIDILVSHPSTAKFIARKLAVKFVSDSPSQGLVDRVAKAFRNSDGDIRVTLRALFSDKEFFAPSNYRAKIKTPFELMVSSLRALDARTNPNRVLVALLNRMGEPLYGYQAPTGYPDTAEDWVNTGALLERMNFAVALASNRIPQTGFDPGRFAAQGERTVLDRAIENILNGEVSENTRSILVKQADKPLPEITLGDRPAMRRGDRMNRPRNGDEGRRNRNRGRFRLRQPKGDPEVFKVVSLVLGSPEFQRQ